jgi:hypothetical protein
MVDEIELVRFVMQNLRGAGFVTIQTLTEVKLNAEGRAILGEVYKRARVNGVVNFRYQNSVNRQRTREALVADFVAAERRWGSHVVGTPFIVHITKDGQRKMYLEMKVERSLGYEYLDAQGNEISKEQVNLYLPKKNDSRQGVEKEVILRDYDVQNLTGVRINGVEVAQEVAA